MILMSVVLPAPLGPMMAVIAAGDAQVDAVAAPVAARSVFVMSAMRRSSEPPHGRCRVGRASGVRAGRCAPRVEQTHEGAAEQDDRWLVLRDDHREQPHRVVWHVSDAVTIQS